MHEPGSRAWLWERMRRRPECFVPHKPVPPAWAREWIREIRKEQPMERSDLLRFHYKSLEYQKEEQPVMTPDERSKVGMKLGKIIAAFFLDYPLVVNQEAVEILGIATMYWHCLVYMAYEDA